MDIYNALVEGMRNLPRTVVLRIVIGAILITAALAIIGVQRASAARDPIVEAGRASVRADARDHCNGTSGFLNAATKGVYRWRCTSFGASNCSRSKHKPSFVRCTAWHRNETTAEPPPFNGHQEGAYSSAQFHLQITRDGRALRIAVRSEPRWSSNLYDAGAARIAQAHRPVLTVGAVKLRSALVAQNACMRFARSNHLLPNPPTQQLNICEAWNATHCRLYDLRRRGKCHVEFIVVQPGRQNGDTAHCDGTAYTRGYQDGLFFIIDTNRRVRWSCDVV